MTRPLIVAALVTAALGSALAIGVRLGAHLSAQSMFPRAADARYRLLSEDIIARPDQRTVVDGAKVWTITDRVSNRCYTVFFVLGGMATVGPVDCP